MSQRHRTAKVLVVDDEAMVRVLLQRMLEEAGYDVLAAANGADALAIVGMFAVDLVITDLRMPVMTGEELGAHIAQLPNPPHVVYASASNVPPEGVDHAHYLQKPFNTDDLRRKVEALLR